MNNSAHKPGPWSLGIIKATMLNPRSMAVWPDQVEIGQVAEPICLIAPMANYNDTDEANARLIAAAPDLLESLEWAVKNLKSEASIYGVEKCLETIQKAKNKQQ